MFPAKGKYFSNTTNIQTQMVWHYPELDKAAKKAKPVASSEQQMFDKFEKDS